MCVHVCVCESEAGRTEGGRQVLMHTRGGQRQRLGVGFLLLLWVPGPEFRLSGLHPLSHLTAPITSTISKTSVALKVVTH